MAVTSCTKLGDKCALRSAVALDSRRYLECRKWTNYTGTPVNMSFEHHGVGGSVRVREPAAL